MQNQMHKTLELLQYDFPLHFAVAERVAALDPDSLNDVKRFFMMGCWGAGAGGASPLNALIYIGSA
jgi:hypothetical protein